MMAVCEFATCPESSGPKLGWNLSIDGIEKLARLYPALAAMQLADNFAAFGIEGGKQEGICFRSSRVHGCRRPLRHNARDNNLVSGFMTQDGS
jgi:hypothetical protein